ncbi:MAG: putative bifunctional diguanylate cyclase/phosphodiesterase [Ruminococcus sp.]
MNQILCSEGFQHFFDALQKSADSIEEMAQTLKDSFPLIADALPVGKLMVRFTAPQTVLDPSGQNRVFEIYCCPDGHADIPYKEEFHNEESGNAVIAFYPRSSSGWEEEEKPILHFLAQNIFLFLGRTRMMQMMKRISVTDLLTGAANTRGFMQFGDALYEKGILCQYTCMFINIKNFNYINQTVGPRQGDEILRQYAQMIQTVMDEEEILSRLGGDNFTALVKTKNVDHVLQFMSNIKITVPYLESTKTFDICARIGMCAITETQTMGEIMNATSTAINIAKTAGQGDYVWFQPQMLANALHDKEISILFPKALEEREFVVYYQPKVTLADNHLCGCEALVRWIRNGKLVPPMEFIPVLEKEGTICRLDFYVLETVCMDIKKWLSEGIEPVRVSVNFSKAHLHNEHLAEDIIAVLRKYEIDSKYIEVELTEMSGYENYETLSAFVQEMRKNGVSTSIDDFGTGYSSLNLLKDLNVDIIKLDKSFLNNMENRCHNDIIVIKNIVNMVNELEMEVIAEGVETQKQAEFLRNINCRMAQGFLFDRPLPHDDFEKRLQDQHTYTFSNT